MKKILSWLLWRSRRVWISSITNYLSNRKINSNNLTIDLIWKFNNKNNWMKMPIDIINWIIKYKNKTNRLPTSVIHSISIMDSLQSKCSIIQCPVLLITNWIKALIIAQILQIQLFTHHHLRNIDNTGIFQTQTVR